MAGKDRGTLPDGTQYTVGTCDDGQYKGKWYVSLGTKKDHTTFIVNNPDDAKVEAIKARGSDLQAWRYVALKIVQSADYWD